MRRSPAWGATTIWIGSGERPTAGAADHVLWLDDPDPRVPATGGFVLFYHLLWELTHVCFEHSGLLKPECAELGAPPAGGGVCVTCSDEGRMGEVVTPSADGMAAVRTARGVESVATALIDPVVVGELVLVHAGHRDQSHRRGAALMEEEPTNFLYPFIDAQEDDPQSLLADLAASAQAKAAESLALRRTTLEANADLLDQAAAEMARRFAAGGRMFTFGNGGSCTDSTTLGRVVLPPAGRKAATRLVVDRRSGDRDRAGQRRRVRVGVRPPVDRPREGR